MSKNPSHSFSPYKILLLGDSSVGKTTFFYKVIDNKSQGNYLSSIGIDVRTSIQEIKDKNNNKLKLSLKLWDTAGQERFRELSMGYVKDADAIVLMFDISNKDSFDNLKDWITRIENNNCELKYGKYLIKLIGNKEDLRQKETRTPNVTLSDVEEEFKDSLVEFYGFYSAKEDSQEKLNGILNKITQELYEKIGVKYDNGNVRELSMDDNKKDKCCN